MKRSGFTMVELIMVIVVIGVLASVAVPKFLGVKPVTIEFHAGIVHGGIVAQKCQNISPNQILHHEMVI